MSLELHVTGPEGFVARCDIHAAELWVGRDPSCALVLDAPAVSRRHLCLRSEGDRLEVRDCSANGTLLAGDRLHLGRRSVVAPVDIRVGPFSLRAATARGAASSPAQHARARFEDVPPAARRRLHAALLEELDLVRLDPARMDRGQLEPRVRRALERIVAEAPGLRLDAAATQRLVDELADEALGLGPLEALLGDPAVSEIMVVDPATIFCERGGRIERTALCFTDDDSVRSVIERIVTPLGRRIDESNPLVDARLPDGSRVNAIIPPLATRGPCITIRKFPATALTMAELVAAGSLSTDMARLLERSVQARRNVVISGGTGSGKTTLLNVLSGAIGSAERIVTIEDAAELRLPQEHVVTLEARPANAEGKGAFSIRDLVKNALRMRPDRIVVGECRGGEAIDMLQAMNTGHEGSMTTTHANSPREAVARLETLCLMAGLDLPLSAVRHQIASSVHLVVQQTRLSDGSRRVTRIAEVAGIEDHGEVVLQDIFRFVRTATGPDGEVVGEHRRTGYLPSFVGELLALGLAEEGRPW